MFQIGHDIILVTRDNYFLTLQQNSPPSLALTTFSNSITIPDNIIWHISENSIRPTCGFQFTQISGGTTYYINCNANPPSGDTYGPITADTTSTDTGTMWICAQNRPGEGSGVFLIALTQNGSYRFMNGSGSSPLGSVTYPDFTQGRLTTVWRWALAVKVCFPPLPDGTIGCPVFTPPIFTPQSPYGGGPGYEFLDDSSKGMLYFYLDPELNGYSFEPCAVNPISPSSPEVNQYLNSAGTSLLIAFRFVSGSASETNLTFSFKTPNGTVFFDPQVSNTGQSSGGGY